MKLFLFVVALLSFTSCSMVKRITSHNHLKFDSSNSHHIDSSTVIKKTDSTSTFTLDSTDIEVEIGDDTLNKPVDTFSNKSIQIIHDIVKAVAGKNKPKKVIIHIGKLRDSVRVIKTTDSTGIKASDTLHYVKIIDTKTEQTERTSYVIFGIVVFALIAIFIIFKFKLFILCLLLSLPITQTRVHHHGLESQFLSYSSPPRQHAISYTPNLSYSSQNHSLPGMLSPSPCVSYSESLTSRTNSKRMRTGKPTAELWRSYICFS